MPERLKYLSTAIVFQEVPDEISLAINISGCPHHCEGCHSKYLWEYKGNYISDDIESLIEKYDGYITCVCFMGGDQNLEELNKLCSTVRDYGLKCCVYSGSDDLSISDVPYFDYIKIGSYQSDRGGLDSPNTNQRMFRRERECFGRFFTDITHWFWKKG